MSKSSDSAGKNLLFGLSVAALAAAATMPGTAEAQTTEPVTTDAEAEEIVVTGFRQSLAAAIELKRDSAAQIDAIVAEDIADFPDLNLSESVQRIPGVAITRDAGEGRQVTVRGLGPQFTRVRINGMEALSTGGGTDAAGGTNRDRSFDFNIFASDLFNSITVRKTASAETEEGSLGATVDLRTVRPFDLNDFTVAISGQAGYNDLSEEYDPRAAFLISDTFLDGKLGALFSIAYSNRSLLEEGASTVRWRDGSGTNAFQGLNATYSGTATLAEINAAFRPRIPRYDIYQHEQDRTGATVSLQYRPTDAARLDLDLLYANFDASRAEIFLESPTFSATGAGGAGGVCIEDAEIQGNSLVFAEFTNCAGNPGATGVDIRSEARFDELSTKFYQATLSGQYDVTDRLRALGMVGWAQSDHENPVQTTILWDRANIPAYGWDYRQDNRLPTITYGATDVTDPSIWALSQIRLRPQTALNTYTAATGDLVFDVTDSVSLRGGVNWKRYEFKTTELRRDPLQPGIGPHTGCTSASFNLASNAEGCLGQTPVVPTSAYAALYALANGSSGNTNVWSGPDFDAAVAALDLDNPNRYPLSAGPALGNNRKVEEDDLGGYLQADWNTELAGIGFRGNVGVRYVETQLTSSGFTFLPPNQVAEVSADHTYEDTLPSLNVVIEPMDDFLVRFAAAKVMSRPGLGNLSPAPSVSVSGANRVITVGNPELDPFRATTYDLGFEWYFAEESLLSLALFHKEIDSFVTTLRETIPTFAANPAGIPQSFADAACGGAATTCATSDTWQFNQAVNTPGGPVKGFEVGLQLPFFFLPDVLSNFGFAGNYTYVESEITYLGSDGLVSAVDDLTGLSRNSYNATLYYEDDRFSARVSANHRSSYLTNVPGRDGNETEETNSTLNIDTAASFAVNDRLRFTFEGVNLTDEANDQYLTPDDRLSFYHTFGRTYFLGFRYSY